MPVEVRPLGSTCNIQCQYCYQNSQRDGRGQAPQYDLDAIKRAVELEGGPVHLFGGEPLMMPFADLEDLLTWGQTRYGHSAVQTNGTLITDRHLELFGRLKVGVGISVDGPGPLNDARWCGSLQKTRETTKKTLDALENILERGLPVSLIITIHRANATQDRLTTLLRWLARMDQSGVRSARIHLLEVDDPEVARAYAMSAEENISALLALRDAERSFRNLRFDIFAEVRDLLLGKDEAATCVWRACDPYTTAAVRGVEGMGQRSNCGRTYKDGVEFVKSDVPRFDRYIALYETPQSVGGCAGCRFFLMCKGQCPGTAIDGDWRNRTEHCSVWLAIFTTIEEELVRSGIVPLTNTSMRAEAEAAMNTCWRAGANPSVASVLRFLRQNRPSRGEGTSADAAAVVDSRGVTGRYNVPKHWPTTPSRAPNTPSQAPRDACEGSELATLPSVGAIS
jgi:uncharacterized protein